MANFTTVIPNLAEDVIYMINKIGHKPNLQKFFRVDKKTKYTIRICKNAKKFIEEINIIKN